MGFHPNILAAFLIEPPMAPNAFSLSWHPDGHDVLDSVDRLDRADAFDAGIFGILGTFAIIVVLRLVR